MDLVNKVSEFADLHIRVISNVGYVAIGIGALLITRKARLLTKFRHVQDIPKYFVDRGILLRGVVKEVTPDLLKVDHLPPFSLYPSFLKKANSRSGNGVLALRFAGIELTDEGRASLEKELCEKVVWFRLVQRVCGEPSPVAVYIRKNLILRNANVRAVGLGLAAVVDVPSCANRKFQGRLQRDLLRAQRRAAAKKLGMWKD